MSGTRAEDIFEELKKVFEPGSIWQKVLVHQHDLLKSFGTPTAKLKIAQKVSCNDETWHSYTLPKEDPKNKLITWSSSWVLLKSAFFHQKLANFAISRVQILIAFHYIISNYFNILWVFKDVLINLVTILMMSAKMASLGLLQIKVFENKDYDIIVSTHDVINNILSRSSDYIVDVVMWPKFGNSMGEVIITLIL